MCEETFRFGYRPVFVDFVLSCIYCTRIVQVYEQKIREIILENPQFFQNVDELHPNTRWQHNCTTLKSNYLKVKTTNRLRSFMSDNLRYSDGKNLKRNYYENMPRIFSRFFTGSDKQIKSQ